MEEILLLKLNAPIPHKCPFCRRNDRHKQTNSFRSYKTHCQKCNKEINSNYDPKDNKIIYCEKCYQEEVY